MQLSSPLFSARWGHALLLPAAIIALAPTAVAESEDGEAYMGESPDRYGAIRLLEGQATIRKGEVEEPLTRGIPVAEGDVVESHGRGVLQLADGTRIAFGVGTRFEVASLFNDRDDDQEVLLKLDRGRLRVAVGRESEAQLRIDTPSGTAVARDGADVGVEVERDRVVRLRVHAGRVVFRNDRDRTSLRAGERLTTYSSEDRLDRVQDFNTYGGDDFDRWSDRHLAVRRGPSWDKVPPEIRYYTDDLDAHGEWVYVDEYRTWCWRPLRVSAEWRPYWRGRWGAYPGGMTWISDEPWGYVTYHHGRWGWSTSIGWYWIPGVYYAPAWVAWQTSGTYFGWAPIGYHNHPVNWGYGPWGGGYCWNIVEINIIHSHHIHHHTHHHPGVIRPFNPGGNRSLTPGWRQGPLMVNQREFRDPAQMQRVIEDRNTMAMRLRSYEQEANRTVYRRPLSRPMGSAPGPATAGPSFEDRSRLQTHRPVIRMESSPTGTATAPQPNRSLGRPPLITAPPTVKGPAPIQPQPIPGPRPTSRPTQHGGAQAPTTQPPMQNGPQGSSQPPVYIPPPANKKRPLGRP